MRRLGIAVACVGAAMLVAGCTSSSSTTTPATSSTSVASSSLVSSVAPASSAPVSTAVVSSTPVSAPSTSVAQSSARPSTSSKPTTTSGTVKVVVPTTLASTAKSDAQFAVTAYEGMLAVSDQARAKPSSDWTKAVRTYAGDPYAASFLASIQQNAASGIRGSGHIAVAVAVTSVAARQIVISGCVDTSAVKISDKSGKSIKAPNQPGSYWRFPQTVTLYKYALKDAPKTGGWLVSEIKSNLQKTC